MITTDAASLLGKLHQAAVDCSVAQEASCRMALVVGLQHMQALTRALQSTAMLLMYEIACSAAQGGAVGWHAPTKRKHLQNHAPHAMHTDQ